MLDWMQDPGDRLVKWGWLPQGVEEDPDATHHAGAVTFHPARRNPVCRSAILRCHLAHAGQARLEIYDVDGRLARTLCNASLEAGEHALAWDATDDDGRPLGGSAPRRPSAVRYRIKSNSPDTIRPPAATRV